MHPFKFIAITIASCIYLSAGAQFTRQDTLRGSDGAARSWWNVLHYDIWVKPDLASKKITGTNEIEISFRKLPETPVVQLDLQRPMKIDSVVFQEKKASFTREGNVYFIHLTKIKSETRKAKVKVYFSGKPREAINAPWDGGWVWAKDAKNRPWITVACQGLGASVWYPCKDYQGDEPDNGAALSITIPDSLVAVGNGKLVSKSSGSDQTTWRWEVVSPINNYNIVPYIGHYKNWTEVFDGEKGKLDCNYWVLDYNLERSKKQFTRDVKPMLTCFENWFGPYPFYEDGYKLVETPHLGMEHQSAIAYGNKFNNGYLGNDLSGTGHGLTWDYIIVHESGHEWFGNNVTTNDIADMWVHEGFTDYSEVLFVECQSGKKAADEYCRGIRRNIRNDRPVIGRYGVNNEGSGDMYAKGANLIHTIRQLVNDDVLFKKILRGLNKEFYHQTIDSRDVEEYFARMSGKSLSLVFDQYLRTANIPELQYSIKGKDISYRWKNCIPGFKMPVRVIIGNKPIWITPSEKWQKLPPGMNRHGKEFIVDKNFYITVRKV
jgi:aminopeptidase N